MGLAVVYTRALLGLEAPQVQVEVNVARGISHFQIIGMPETTVREAKDRVRTALLNSNYEFPIGRITVNLSPAELPKQGARYDLAIALGVLVASGQLDDDSCDNLECYGELALDGALRPVQGTIPSLMACQRQQRKAIIPAANASEAGLLRSALAFAMPTLNAVVDHIRGNRKTSAVKPHALQLRQNSHGDMSDVKGQEQAKRALLLAAAGGHNILFVGPPGTGKTMLAQRMLSLMSALSEEDGLEVAAIQSISGQPFAAEHWRQRPFRNPHHSCSAAALVGGGSIPKPGEITLAHKGLLFLDELAEIPRHILDSLREPLESGQVCISRAQHSTTYPARFQLICALNPSPCGSFDGDIGSARATPDQILNYLSKISGPFLDRIDLQVDVPRQPEVLRAEQSSVKVHTSAELRLLVEQTQEIQLQRQGCLNSMIPASDIAGQCQLLPQDHEFLVQAIEKLKLSHRAYHRIMRLARTIADLQESSCVQRKHLAEAMSYRALDALLKQLRNL
ncbi:ATP-dependent protease [Aliidiomarina minuta]|uniref:ATP-dependent protease n=1 Tax=Aliidiomarina minuta TaxID=880057 RepID=A0A432W9W4_9GAMM|nr:YifB family Mg chelatase-like AAA ATPase [Aliidiomarina minuta]RUO26825.1 ATP-dependent protease [Aliidiomarina minuta]